MTACDRQAEPLIIPIDNPEDERIAEYRNIREGDLVGRLGKFVAEGKFVLQVLLNSRHYEPESVLLLENRLNGLHDILQQAPREIPIYCASGAVLDSIAGYKVHRGILAIGKRSMAQKAEALLQSVEKPSTVVGLVGISNHDNIGAIFRNAAAFGADAVLLDETCSDPLYRKAIRVSAGTTLIIPFARAGSAGNLLDLLLQHGFQSLALSPASSRTLTDHPHPGRLALLLGSEGHGLPDHVMQQTTNVSIAMSPRIDSLNVATAAAIALHHYYESGTARSGRY